MDARCSAELCWACKVVDAPSQTPLRPSELGCTLVRNPEAWNNGNDFVFQFNLFSFFDRVKGHLPSLNLKANYSCFIFILIRAGERSLASTSSRDPVRLVSLSERVGQSWAAALRWAEVGRGRREARVGGNGERQGAGEAGLT